MSKIGKKPINLLEEVTLRKIDEHNFEIQGPKGHFLFTLPPGFKLEINDKILTITPLGRITKDVKAKWGTLRSILNNKIIGVSQGFEKVLILEGLGYSAEIKDQTLVFKLGYSHPVRVDIPEGIEITIKPEKDKRFIYLKGIDKEKLGIFAARIKSLKPADRYHQKGFRYLNEIIKLKPVKKAVK